MYRVPGRGPITGSGQLQRVEIAPSSRRPQFPACLLSVIPKECSDVPSKNPSKKKTNFLLRLRNRELGRKTGGSSNKDLYDAVLRSPIRSFEARESLEGHGMSLYYEGHFFQYHRATLQQREPVRSWRSFRYIGGEKYLNSVFIDVYSESGTGPYKLLAVVTTRARVFFLDLDEEKVVKYYQLPKQKVNYTCLNHSIQRNELAIFGRTQEHSAVAIFELHPLRLKMFFETDKEFFPGSLRTVIDRGLVYYNTKQNKLSVYDWEQIYKNYCFDIDEPSHELSKVIKVEPNVRVTERIEPLIRICCPTPHNVGLVGPYMFVNRFIDEDAESSSTPASMFFNLKRPNIKQTLVDNKKWATLSGFLYSVEDRQDDRMYAVDNETRILATEGSILSCFNIENDNGNLSELRYTCCWRRQLWSGKETIRHRGRMFLLQSDFTSIRIRHPYVYCNVSYFVLDDHQNFVLRGCIIYIFDLDTGQLVNAIPVDESLFRLAHSCKCQAVSLDDFEVCFQSHSDGKCCLTFFRLVEEAELRHQEEVYLKGKASYVPKALSRSQRRNLRRSASVDFTRENVDLAV